MAATTASTADQEMMTFLPHIGNSSGRQNEQQQQGNYNNNVGVDGDGGDEPFDDNIFGDGDDDNDVFVDASVVNGCNVSQQRQNFAMTAASIANAARTLYTPNCSEAAVGMDPKIQKMMPVTAPLPRQGESYGNVITLPNGGGPLVPLHPPFQAAVTSASTMVGPWQHPIINTAVPQQTQPMACYPHHPSHSYMDQQQQEQQQGSINPKNLRGTIFRQSCGASQENPTSSLPTTSTTTTNNKRKRPLSAQRKTCSKRQQGEEDKKSKKKTRNLREQQRSHQINERIAELQEVLKEIGVHFEKTDKNTVLRTVNEYIRNRQTRSAQLDSEHSRLLETINEVATQARSKKRKSIKTTHKNCPMRVIDNSITPLPSQPQPQRKPKTNNAALFHTPEFNYKTVFSKCPTALAAISLDGRFLDCNSQFEQLTGFHRKELLAMQEKQEAAAASSSTTSSLSSNSSSTNNNDISLFHILYSPTDVEKVCQRMSSLVQCEDGDESSNDDDQTKAEEKDTGRGSRKFWRGVIRSKKKPNVDLIMSITLTKTVDDLPYFYNCALSM